MVDLRYAQRGKERTRTDLGLLPRSSSRRGALGQPEPFPAPDTIVGGHAVAGRGEIEGHLDLCLYPGLRAGGRHVVDKDRETIREER